MSLAPTNGGSGSGKKPEKEKNEHELMICVERHTNIDDSVRVYRERRLVIFNGLQNV